MGFIFVLPPVPHPPSSIVRSVQVMSWFDAEVMQPAASRGLKIQLELVRVKNEIRKPGPVFTATTKVLQQFYEAFNLH